MNNLAGMLLSEEKLARRGDDIAILSNGQAFSYRDLAAVSLHAARTLREHASAPGERVLLKGRDTRELVAGILGAMAADLIPVILSPRVTEGDLRYVADETGSTLLVEDDALGTSRTSLRRLPTARLVPQHPVDVRHEALAGCETRREAFWLYSSGTTGRMKGVIHGHNALSPVLEFHEKVLGIGRGTRTFCTSRISFAYAMSNGFLAPLALGATVALQADWPTPESTLETIQAVRPDVVFSVPSMYRAWLELPGDSLRAMSSVKRFVSAGEHLPVPVAERWQSVIGKAILDCYGCSETCFLVFASDPDRPRPGSVGFPCAGVETALRDEHGAPAPEGRAGRLFIRHPFLALSYGPAAAASAQARFQDGWFATGDVFRRDHEGYWHHYGREDDWLKIAGQWVSLRGVEEAASALDDVDQAVGVTASDANGFLRVALFAVPAATSDASALAQRLQDFLEEQLPAFKRPKWIRVVEDLPRTSTGKVRKAELRRMIEEEVT